MAVVVYGSSRKLNLSELQMANIELMSNDDGGINLQFCHPYDQEGEPLTNGKTGKNRCKEGTPTTYFTDNVPTNPIYPCNPRIYKTLIMRLYPTGYCYVKL